MIRLDDPVAHSNRAIRLTQNLYIAAIMTHFHGTVAALAGALGNQYSFLQRPKLGHVDRPGFRLQTYRVLGSSFIS